MSSARYLTGAGANDTLWSNSQGMGAVNLGAGLRHTAPALVRPAPRRDVHRQRPELHGNRHDRGAKPSVPSHAGLDRRTRVNHRSGLQQRPGSHGHGGRPDVQGERLLGCFVDHGWRRGYAEQRGRASISPLARSGISPSRSAPPTSTRTAFPILAATWIRISPSSSKTVTKSRGPRSSLQGMRVEKVDVDVEEVAAWCTAAGRPFDSKARAEYASETLRKRDLPGAS